MTIGHDLVALALFVVIAGAAGMLIATIVEGQRPRSRPTRPRIAALEQADRQRGALLRSVSHDLRTPLATIRAVATDLHSDAPVRSGVAPGAARPGDRRGRAARPHRGQPAAHESHRGRVVPARPPGRRRGRAGRGLAAPTPRTGARRRTGWTSTSSPTSRWSHAGLQPVRPGAVEPRSRTRPATPPAGGAMEVARATTGRRRSATALDGRLRVVDHGPAALAPRGPATRLFEPFASATGSELERCRTRHLPKHRGGPRWHDRGIRDAGGRRHCCTVAVPIRG